MRTYVHTWILSIAGFMLAAASASEVAADGSDVAPSHRVVVASESDDEPPALPAIAIELAAPAVSPIPERPSAPLGAPAATPEERELADAKLPVVPLPKHYANSSALLARTMPDPLVTSQARQALGFYGGLSARATLNQFPRRSPIQPGPRQPIRQQVKPFQAIERGPTVSPYLNLYRDETEESAPNYFAFVRPQFEQVEANRMQQAEMQHLTRQLNGRSTTVAGPQYRATRSPGASTPARYMDTAQFYGGWR